MKTNHTEGTYSKVKNTYLQYVFNFTVNSLIIDVSYNDVDIYARHVRPNVVSSHAIRVHTICFAVFFAADYLVSIAILWKFFCSLLAGFRWSTQSEPGYKVDTYLYGLLVHPFYFRNYLKKDYLKISHSSARERRTRFFSVSRSVRASLIVKVKRSRRVRNRRRVHT